MAARKGSVTIKELHAKTGEYVRQAGRGRSPLTVTDRGKVVAAPCLWIPLDSSIVEQVVRTFTTLPANVFLRTADCLHLVTALQQGFAEIHTHDTHQRNGASALGLNAVAIE